MVHADYARARADDAFLFFPTRAHVVLALYTIIRVYKRYYITLCAVRTTTAVRPFHLITRFMCCVFFLFFFFRGDRTGEISKAQCYENKKMFVRRITEGDVFRLRGFRRSRI